MKYSVDERRSIMNRANDAKLRFQGIPVQVGGCRNDFAGVTIKPGHPLAGFSAEYSWETIKRATDAGGVLGA